MGKIKIQGLAGHVFGGIGLRAAAEFSDRDVVCRYQVRQCYGSD